MGTIKELPKEAAEKKKALELQTPAQKRAIQERERLAAQATPKLKISKRAEDKGLVRSVFSIRPRSLFDGNQSISCGYCGSNVIIYMHRAAAATTQGRTMLHGCARPCEIAPFHRVNFVDKFAFELLVKEIRSSFALLSKAELPQLRRIDPRLFALLNVRFREQGQLLEILERGTAMIEEVTTKLRAVTAEIEKIEGMLEQIARFPERKNPLIMPLLDPNFVLTDEFGLLHQRALVRMFIRSVRVFEEYLIVRMLDLQSGNDDKTRFVHFRTTREQQEE